MIARLLQVVALVAGVVALVQIPAVFFDSRLDETVVTVPGEREFELDEDKYDLWYDVFDAGRNDILSPPSEIVLEPATGDGPVLPLDYDVDHPQTDNTQRRAQRFAVVSVPRAGRWRLAVAGVDPARIERLRPKVFLGKHRDKEGLIFWIAGLVSMGALLLAGRARRREARSGD